jgi:hypothetical protein
MKYTLAVIALLNMTESVDGVMIKKHHKHHHHHNKDKTML